MGCNGSKSPSSAIPKSETTPLNRDDNKTVEVNDSIAGKSTTLLADLHNSTGNFGSKRGFNDTANGPSLEEELAAMSNGKVINKANSDMIANLQKKGVIKNTQVKNAMLCTDRGDYAPSESREWNAAYEDAPLPIGMSATISAPHMHARALDLLADHLVYGACVLDIGCGSGYVASCMARMVGPEGLVVGIEHLKPLVDLGIENIRKTDGDLLDSGQVVVLHGDGWKGCPQDILFDCIHVGAAAETIPTPLLEQLKPGGRMVIPVGTQNQHFYQIDRKLDGEYIKTQLMPVRYVPLAKTDLGAAFLSPSRNTTTPVQQSEVEVAGQAVDERKSAATEIADKDFASFEVLETKVNGATVVQPPETYEPPTLVVKGAPSVEPSDARCRWCKDVCC